jgi:RNA polymerase sigma-B factor
MSHLPATPIPRTRRQPVRLLADADERRAEERRLLALYARERDPAVLEELVELFMPLARKLALRYRAGQEPVEDLVQIASVGLVNAIGRFDPDRGLAFTSFAVPTILGELKRHFRDRTWSVHVNRGVKDRSVAVENAIEQLAQTTGRSPSVSEIADRTELSAEEVLEAIDAGNARRTLSMEGGVEGDGEEPAALADRVGETDPGYDAVEYGTAIEPVLEELSERDRAVIRMRFVEDRTQSEIAARIGVSQMQVSRILRALLHRFREQVPQGT